MKKAVLLTLFLLNVNTLKAADYDDFFRAGLWNLPDPVFEAVDVRYLPNGRHSGSILEYWFPPIILSNPDAGGFSMLENQNLAIRGESALWTRYYLNGLNITNPAVPGTSLFQVPQNLWQAFALQSVLTPHSSSHGVNWLVQPEKNQNMATLSNPGFLGGDSWMGRGIFDREPATGWGADPKRRRFGPSVEGDFFYAIRSNNASPVYVFYEGILHNRTFRNLNPYENGYRNTLYASTSLKGGQTLNLFYQGNVRDYNGIETGHDASLATNGASHALYGDMQAQKNGWNIGVNAGFYSSRFEQNNSEIMVWDLEDEVLYGNAPKPEEQSAWFVGLSGEKKKIATLWSMDVKAGGIFRIEGTTFNPLYKNGAFARTYLDQAYDITIYKNNGSYSQYLTRFYPGAGLEKKWGKWTLNLDAGAMMETGSGNSGLLIYRLEPTAGVNLVGNFTRWTIQAGLMHDAIPLTVQEVSFLNPSSSSGGRYFWNDNGDGIASANEAGTKINRTGGLYHGSASDLKTPVKEELYLRSAFHASPLWDLALSAHGKVFRNLYTVNFPSGYSDGYSEIPRSDITGGVLYNRDPAAFGTEKYNLDNVTQNGYYAALHFQALKISSLKSTWFFNFVIGAYYAEATTVSGNGPDYNDMGIISESSADPNKKINTRARTDFDRGYVSHFVFGFRFLKQFAFTNVFRYRDGETFGEMAIAEGLSQGPTIVQNLERSQPPLGMPRFTYAMSWDVRLSFNQIWGEKRLGIYFDIYNLLDSRSELSEYTLHNESYRNSMEMVIGRSYRLTVSYAW